MTGGAVGRIGQQSLNTTRWAALAAGLPESVSRPSTSAQGVISGAYDAVIASGVESMSRVPIGSQTAGQDPFGTAVADRYPQGLIPQGVSAELTASRWNSSRTQLDAFAAESHRRTADAWDRGLFDREVAAIDTTAQDGTPIHLAHDEALRPGTSVEALAALKPAYHNEYWVERFPEIGWQVTAGKPPRSATDRPPC